MKIFITGITGFVGSTLANKFIDDGFEVTGLGRKESLPAHVHKSCVYVKADITIPIPVINADIVIHAAAQVDDAATYEEHFDVNVTGTFNVLNACNHQCVLFILISTSSVYYFKKNTAFSEEEAGLPFESLSHYGKTKFLAEQLVVQNTELKRKIILRPRAIYGPADTVLLPRLLRLVKGKFLIIPAHLTTQISLTHIYNLAQAVEKCFNYSSEDTAIFNVADDSVYSLKEALPALLSTVVSSPLKTIVVSKIIWNAVMALNNIFHFIPKLTSFGSKQLTQVALLNTVKIKEELGYDPQFIFTKFIMESKK